MIRTVSIIRTLILLALALTGATDQVILSGQVDGLWPAPQPVELWVQVRGETRRLARTWPDSAGRFAFALTCPEPPETEAYILTLPGAEAECRNPHGYASGDHILYQAGLCHQQELTGNLFHLPRCNTPPLYLPDGCPDPPLALHPPRPGQPPPCIAAVWPEPGEEGEGLLVIAVEHPEYPPDRRQEVEVVLDLDRQRVVDIRNEDYDCGKDEKPLAWTILQVLEEGQWGPWMRAYGAPPPAALVEGLGVPLYRYFFPLVLAGE